ncbi:DUF746 domain-containing protein [Collimonas pratensis]|uniref:Helix-turn-helix domain protein n=1 Tax=Collimonas pratensis TaxID=279113 RepID=A0ABM5Z8P9_9BURK|nr:DUF746 domain-containing protein [Collimonas pratensis]AMP15472.1 helix-turn-helix domain protein [Collimonas pratensis]
MVTGTRKLAASTLLDIFIWTPKADTLLGTASDQMIAIRLGISKASVGARRRQLKIRSFASSPLKWTTEMEACLGTDLDTVIAKKLGVNRQQVFRRRNQLGIPPKRAYSEPLKNIVAAAGSPSAPSKPYVSPKERNFFVDHLQFRRAGNTFPDSEDHELTAYLIQAYAEAHSTSLRPPTCPHCFSRRTTLGFRPRPGESKPGFHCKTCDKRFNRLTGTPLARLRHATLMPEFFRLLSQQLPYEEAARRLDVFVPTIRNWAKKIRLWLLQLDPSGEWEAKARLGIKLRPRLRCPRCGDDGEKRFFGQDVDLGRKLLCLACHSTFSVADAERLVQQKVQLEVLYDPGKIGGEFDARAS